MGKSSRKAKEKKKDFQKVKLKVGKKKPQADNFTDTTFKSRAIQIREQLKSSNKTSDEPLTQRKQNIQDLLCQASHYNSVVRCSAMQGIKSLVIPHPALLHDHLPNLLPILSASMTDKDADVRQAGSALLRVVMEMLPANQMSPFFSTVCLHLCCAMTHIQEEVQLDSLIVMETILQHYPGLIAPHTKELLTNFIHLVSQQRGTVGGPTSLKANPSGKLAGQKWRLKVLQMLQKLVEVINRTTEGQRPDSECSGAAATTVVNVVPGKSTYAGICKANGALGARQRPFILRTTNQSSALPGADFLSSPAAILDVCHTLVPLLLQCWGEVNLPASSGKFPGKSLRGGGGLTIGSKEEVMLQCVLGILHTMWRLMDQACEEKADFTAADQLRKSYQRKVEQHFLQGFPYSSHQQPKTKTKGASSSSLRDSTSGHASLPINLTSCDLLLSVMVEAGNKPRPWLRHVREFVEGILREDVQEGEQQMSQEEQLLLMGVVRKLLDRSRDQQDRESLIDALYLFYKVAHPLSQQKLRSLKTLTAIWLDGTKPSQSKMSPRCCEFFKSLGPLMIAARNSPHMITQAALHTLLTAAARGYQETVDCIDQHFPDWIDEESGIVDQLDASSQARLMECLYYLPTYPPKLITQLTKYCSRLSADIKVPVYLIVNRCFANAFGTTVRPPVSYTDLIDMLLTISMGQSQEDLSSLQTSIAADPSTHPTLGQGSHTLIGSVNPYYYILSDITDYKQLERASNINKIVLQVYQQHTNRDMVLNSVVSRLRETLISCQYIPMRTALSILDHAAALAPFQAASSSSSSPSWSSLPSSSSRSSSSSSTSSTNALASQPSSDDVARLVGTAAFLLLYHTVLQSRQDVERGEETVAVAMFRLTLESLATCGEDVVDNLLRVACEVTSAHPSKQAGSTVTYLLQTNSLKRRLLRYNNRLLTLIRELEANQSCVKGSQWFTELRYEVSILDKEASTHV